MILALNLVITRHLQIVKERRRRLTLKPAPSPNRSSNSAQLPLPKSSIGSEAKVPATEPDLGLLYGRLFVESEASVVEPGGGVYGEAAGGDDDGHHLRLLPRQRPPGPFFPSTSLSQTRHPLLCRQSSCSSTTARSGTTLSTRLTMTSILRVHQWILRDSSVVPRGGELPGGPQPLRQLLRLLHHQPGLLRRLPQPLALPPPVRPFPVPRGRQFKKGGGRRLLGRFPCVRRLLLRKASNSEPSSAACRLDCPFRSLPLVKLPMGVRMEESGGPPAAESRGLVPEHSFLLPPQPHSPRSEPDLVHL